MEEFLKEYSKLLDGSNDHLSNSAFATYLNLTDQLSAKEKDFIERHLQSCSACREKLELIRQEDSEIDPEQTVQTDRFRFTQQWKYATAAVIVIGLLTILYFTLSPQNEELFTEETIFNDSTEVIKSDTLDSSSQSQKMEPADIVDKNENESLPEKEVFAVNNVLENFINRNVRSENKILIISPELSDTVHAPITFKWKLSATVKDLKLILVDNKNIIIYQVSIAGNELTIDKKLIDGLYYWKLEADGKLETVGKIFVIN